MTTILSVRRNGQVALGGDGQVTMNNQVVKHDARKIRKLAKGKVLVGFAGAAADAMALMDRFDEMLNKHPGNTLRAAAELAKLWRTDKILRRLDAVLAAVSLEGSLLISGNGDLMEPEDGILAIGSGSAAALGAARALLAHSQLSAADIVREGLKIAAGICVFTNDRLMIETLEPEA